MSSARGRDKTVRGKVVEWDDREGWGVLSSPDVPELIWVHHRYIESKGYKTLRVGQAVEFEFEDLGEPIQDGYRFRVTRVSPMRQ
jgi:CspA family cold shock protein